MPRSEVRCHLQPVRCGGVPHIDVIEAITNGDQLDRFERIPVLVGCDLILVADRPFRVDPQRRVDADAGVGQFVGHRGLVRLAGGRPDQWVAGKGPFVCRCSLQNEVIHARTIAAPAAPAGIHQQAIRVSLPRGVSVHGWADRPLVDLARPPEAVAHDQAAGPGKDLIVHLVCPAGCVSPRDGRGGPQTVDHDCGRVVLAKPLFARMPVVQADVRGRQFPRRDVLPDLPGTVRHSGHVGAVAVGLGPRTDLGKGICGPG